MLCDRDVGLLGKTCWIDKWVNIILFVDLELRLKMLAWVLPARQPSVTSSLLMATAHLPSTAGSRSRWMMGMGRSKNLCHWDEMM